MDENIKLLLELTRKQQNSSEPEPMRYDVKSLLEESRKRVYTAEGQKVVDAARRLRGDKS